MEKLRKGKNKKGRGRELFPRDEKEEEEEGAHSHSSLSSSFCHELVRREGERRRRRTLQSLHYGDEGKRESVSERLKKGLVWFLLFHLRRENTSLLSSTFSPLLSSPPSSPSRGKRSKGEETERSKPSLLLLLSGHLRSVNILPFLPPFTLMLSCRHRQTREAGADLRLRRGGRKNMYMVGAAQRRQRHKEAAKGNKGRIFSPSKACSH